MQRRRGYAAFKLYYISFRLQASYHSVEILLTRLTRINVLLRHLKQLALTLRIYDLASMDTVDSSKVFFLLQILV